MLKGPFRSYPAQHVVEHIESRVLLSQAGALDLSFNRTGKELSQVDGESSSRDVFANADNVLVVGTSTSQNPSRASAVLYDNDGNPDTDFNGNGKLSFPLFDTMRGLGADPGTTTSNASGGVIDGDTIVVGGTIFTPDVGFGVSQMALARLGLHGNILSRESSGFAGNGAGAVGDIVVIPGGTETTERYMIGGTMRLLGAPPRQLAAAFFNGDGTFAQGALAPVGGQVGEQFALDSGILTSGPHAGEFVFATYTKGDMGGPTYLGLVLYAHDPNDSSPAHGTFTGVASGTYDVGATGDPLASLDVAPDGSVLLAFNLDHNILVRRYTMGATPAWDEDFGTDGTLAIANPGNGDPDIDTADLGDGHFQIIIGTATGDGTISVYRALEDGSGLDESFGIDGHVSTRFYEDGVDGAHNLTVTGDRGDWDGGPDVFVEPSTGRILAGGTLAISTGEAFATARYLPTDGPQHAANPIIEGTNNVNNLGLGDDTYIQRSGSNVNVWVGSRAGDDDPGSAISAPGGDPTFVLDFNSLSTLSIHSYLDRDRLTLDNSGGAAMPSGGGMYDGGANTNNTNTFRAVGANSSDAGTLDIASGTRKFRFGSQGFLNFANVQVTAFNTGNFITGSSDLNATPSDLFSIEVGTSATLTSNASQHLLDDVNNPEPNRAALLITHTGKFVMATNGSHLLNVDTLSIPTPANGSVLDLGDNDLRTTNVSFVTIRSWIQSGFNGGAWNGNGIRSSTAAAEPHQATALGYLRGTEYGSSATFDGELVASDDVLVKYTWYGDADLNGVVNFNDYVRIDGGDGSDWFQGDFDYDLAKNFDDYVRIDNAYGNQNSVL